MTTRKHFIGGVLAAGVAPMVVPNTVRGANAPSNRITVGGIGIGGIGNAQLPQMKKAGFEVVALCDLDWQYAERVFKKFPQARKYKDYEEMLRLEGDKIDAVYCGCPDHWHTLVCLAAIAKKKHLCCVKPLTRFVDECRLVVNAARTAGVATQVTANSNCDEASMRLYEYLNAGAIGDVVEAHAWSRRPVWPQGMVSYADWEDPIPEGFNWKKWIGPAKYVPFASKWGKHAPYEKMSKEAWCGDAVYHPFNFRGWFEYGAGALGDMGCHRANTLYKALDLKWPTHVEASCSRVSEVAFPLASMVTFDYPARGTKPECRVIWYDGGLLPPKPKAMGATPLPQEGVLYVGTKGTILFNSQKPAEATVTILEPARAAQFANLPRTLPRRNPDMFREIFVEWLEACKGGAPASCNFDFAQYITEFTHLGNLAIRTAKPIDFDPVAMKITNDNAAADALLHAKYENGWKLS